MENIPEQITENTHDAVYALGNFMKGIFQFLTSHVKYISTLTNGGKAVHITLSLLFVSLVVYFIVKMSRMKCDGDSKFTNGTIQDSTKETKKVRFQKKEHYPKPELNYYYWNQCGHCKKFEPEWEKIKEHAKNTDWIVTEYEVSKDYDFIRDRGIHAFPTITFNDDEIEFKNGDSRNAEFIIDYINDKTKTTTTNQEDVNKE